MASYSQTPLARLHAFITARRGANFEADIFSSLLNCPLVIRSAEFALADGALYATEGVTPPPGNFTERFWQLNEDVRMKGGSTQFRSRILVLFDVKSKVSHKAGDQVYITTMSQRARVSFYICVCAANPGYVELIPNRFGGNECPENERGRDVAVNFSRKSPLPPSAYGALSPCNSPYRMPIALLPEALQNICHCARGSGDYVNPWTRVRFTGWTPYLEHGNDGMMPREDSQHFTSFLSIIEIWRCIRNANRRAKNAIPMHLGFVEHQPRLADFKLLVPSTGAHTTHRQVFVQHKIDGRYRSPASPLTKVSIARNRDKDNINYYFTHHDRFDFLFYQFDYTDFAKRSWRQFFFLPEHELPDEFYETKATEGDFGNPAWEKYWIEQDTTGRWVERVYNIIQSNPQPRKSGHRPARPSGRDDTMPMPVPRSSPNSSRDLSWFHGKIFYNLMAQCASHLSGLLIVLSRGHSMGDFAYCRYRWTEQEQYAFRTHGHPPCTITELPPLTPTVPFHTFTGTKEQTSRGPSLSTANFRRVNSCQQNRLLIFDVLGLEGRRLNSPVLVVPTNDISPTSSQRAVFDLNDTLNHHEGDFDRRVPLLAELLHTDLNPADYAIGARGPLLFENDDSWGNLWLLLDQFTGTNAFMHPSRSNIGRSPGDYQSTLVELHQSLIEQHLQMSVNQVEYIESPDEEDE